MPKQVQMWEAEDGEVFDTQEEAEEHEAREALKNHDLCLSNAQINVLHKMLDDPKFGGTMGYLYACTEEGAGAKREEKQTAASY